MSESYFVRIRGRTHGPFDEKKVRIMVNNGQLSRIHQISTDGQSWEKASSFPEFFESVVDVEPIVLQEVGQAANYASSTTTSNVIQNHGSNDTQEWYYSSNDKQYGPISFSQLVQIASFGQLRANDLVWCDKFTDWQTAKSVEGIFASEPAAQQEQHSETLTHEAQDVSTSYDAGGNETLGGGIDLNSLTTMRKTRPWIFLLAAILCLIGLLSIGSGFLVSILGAQARDYTMIAQGVMTVFFAGMTFFATFFLIRIGVVIGRCARAPSFANLNSMLKASRSFWIFASLGTILYFVLVFVAVIAILAVTKFGAEASETAAVFLENGSLNLRFAIQIWS